jgi:prepilin-type N-terminal cleavage/methylation domain-containing protein
MLKDRGFTLIEIIIVLIIIGILAAVAIPNFVTSMQQGESKSALNNLITIYNAQKSNYLSTGSYCTAACSSEATINTALGLNITDNNYTYTCNMGGSQCTATNGTVTLTLSYGTSTSIVTTGGNSCATASAGGCNPVCSPAGNSACNI